MDTIEGLGNRLKELRTERDMSLDMIVYDINQRYNIKSMSDYYAHKMENHISDILKEGAN